MAKSSKSLSQRMEEELTCAVCCELYTCPLLLQCSHTFCKKCIQDLVQNNDEVSRYGALSSSFKCPVCRRFISLKSVRGIDDLPENLVLANLVAMLKSSDGGSPRLSRQQVPSLDTAECKKHPNNVVSLFCLDCSKPLCPSCSVRCHRHRLKTVEVLWKETWKNVLALMSEAGQKMSTISERVQLLDDQLRGIEDQESSAKGEIKAEVEILKSMLLSKLAQLNAEIHSEVHGLSHPVVQEREMCTNLLGSLESTNNCLQSLQRSHDGVKSVKTLVHLEGQLTSLLNNSVPELLTRAIPVVTMPTWKLLRDNTETSIRTLIIRRTGPFPTESVARVGVSNIQPMRTSPDQVSRQRKSDDLVSDVSMSQNNNSILQPGSRSINFTLGLGNSSSQGHNSSSSGNASRRIPAKPVRNLSTLRKNDRNTAKPVVGSRLFTAPALSTEMANSASFLSVSSASSEISSSLEGAASPDANRGDMFASVQESVSEGVDAILNKLQKIEVTAENWDVQRKKKVKSKGENKTGFKGFGTKVPSSFSFGESPSQARRGPELFSGGIPRQMTNSVLSSGQSQGGLFQFEMTSSSPDFTRQAMPPLTSSSFRNKAAGSNGTKSSESRRPRVASRKGSPSQSKSVSSSNKGFNFNFETGNSFSFVTPTTVTQSQVLSSQSNQPDLKYENLEKSLKEPSAEVNVMQESRNQPLSEHRELKIPNSGFVFHPPQETQTIVNFNPESPGTSELISSGTLRPASATIVTETFGWKPQVTSSTPNSSFSSVVNSITRPISSCIETHVPAKPNSNRITEHVAYDENVQETKNENKNIGSFAEGAFCTNFGMSNKAEEISQNGQRITASSTSPYKPSSELISSSSENSDKIISKETQLHDSENKSICSTKVLVQSERNSDSDTERFLRQNLSQAGSSISRTSAASDDSDDLPFVDARSEPEFSPDKLPSKNTNSNQLTDSLPSEKDHVKEKSKTHQAVDDDHLSGLGPQGCRDDVNAKTDVPSSSTVVEGSDGMPAPKVNKTALQSQDAACEREGFFANAPGVDTAASPSQDGTVSSTTEGHSSLITRTAVNLYAQDFPCPRISSDRVDRLKSGEHVDDKPALMSDSDAALLADSAVKETSSKESLPSVPSSVDGSEGKLSFETVCPENSVKTADAGMQSTTANFCSSATNGTMSNTAASVTGDTQTSGDSGSSILIGSPMTTAGTNQIVMTAFNTPSVCDMAKLSVNPRKNDSEHDERVNDKFALMSDLAAASAAGCGARETIYPKENRPSTHSTVVASTQASTADVILSTSTAKFTGANVSGARGFEDSVVSGSTISTTINNQNSAGAFQAVSVSDRHNIPNDSSTNAAPEHGAKTTTCATNMSSIFSFGQASSVFPATSNPFATSSATPFTFGQSGTALGNTGLSFPLFPVNSAWSNSPKNFSFTRKEAAAPAKLTFGFQSEASNGGTSRGSFAGSLFGPTTQFLSGLSANVVKDDRSEAGTDKNDLFQFGRK